MSCRGTDQTDAGRNIGVMDQRRTARYREREEMHDDAAFEYYRMARDAKKQGKYAAGIWNGIVSQYHVILACHYAGLAKANEVIG
ncbi:MAG: hypothetical protein AABX14_02605 [Candidatus Aenigmatarchaeota archaeon]